MLSEIKNLVKDLEYRVQNKYVENKNLDLTNERDLENTYVEFGYKLRKYDELVNATKIKSMAGLKTDDTENKYLGELKTELEDLKVTLNLNINL